MGNATGGAMRRWRRKARRQPPAEESGAIPVDVPEADALEQARAWVEPAEPEHPVTELPEDAAEADALEQALPVAPVEQDEDRR
jgi:hypothetical protein